VNSFVSATIYQKHKENHQEKVWNGSLEPKMKSDNSENASPSDVSCAVDSSEDLEMLQLSFDDLTDTDVDQSYENQSSNGLMDGIIYPKKDSMVVDETVPSEYILGTLIVRVVAARDLKNTRKGHLLNSQGRRRIFQRLQPYTVANVSFGKDLQRTSCVEETVNPTWTRSEYPLLFDISLPIPHLAQEGPSWLDNVGVEADAIHISTTPLRKPILTVSLFHTDNRSSSKGKKLQSQSPQDNHDDFMGTASIDVTPVITGKVSSIDKWLQFDPTDDASGSGSVRVIVEYDCIAVQPRIGDKVRFNGFIDPALCPLPRSQIFRVEEVLGDDMILSYITALEQWKCVFQVHRFILISVERHVSAVERYQEELISLTTRVINSPAADMVSETMRSLPEEGLLFVGIQAAFGGMALFERWKKNGLSAAVDDVVYATNLDGQHSPDENDDDLLSIEDDIGSSITSLNDDTSSLGSSTDADYSIASGMPCCPITGQPMRRPVVAADGNTYERSAIRRWLRSSDISPLAGIALKHKDLIPNYMLISSLQNGKKSEESSQVSQF
jgi:hypothetical protein